MNAEIFLKEFQRLRDFSPRLFSTTRDCDNCLYTHDLVYSKDCYYVFAGGWAQECYYGEILVQCKNCVDCLKIEQCELCYECVDCYQCYNSDYLLQCSNSYDSEYCFGLKDCNNCFLSSNQSHKSFIFQNRQCTKEEFLALVAEYKKTHTTAKCYEEFLRLSETAIRVNLSIINSEDCLGNYISDSKNVYFGFDVVNGEGYLYSEESGYGRDSCDVLFTGEGELMYECIDVSKKSYNCSFCLACVTCADCEFCITCYECADCFGCAYMRGKKFHILNAAYAADDYRKTVALLRRELREKKVYSLDLLRCAQVK